MNPGISLRVRSAPWIFTQDPQMGFLCSRMVFIPFNVDFMDQNLFWFLGKNGKEKNGKEKPWLLYFMMEPWFLREKTMDLKPQKISARFRQGSLATLNSVTDSRRQQIQAGELNRQWEMGVGRVASIKLLGWRTSLPTVIVWARTKPGDGTSWDF